jgi:glutathione S-transferase
MPDAVRLAAIITVLACVFTFFAAYRVSMMRRAHAVEAPATTGHPNFERAYRIHMNTIESLVLFLPLLWMGAILYSGVVAFILGLVWLVGRLMYMMSYTTDPSRRAPGAYTTMFALVGLLVLSLLGIAVE